MFPNNKGVLLLLTMDCPYRYGYDDGGQGGDSNSGDASRHVAHDERTCVRTGDIPLGTAASRGTAPLNRQDSPSRLLYDTNGSPTNSFYLKPNDGSGSISPTSVAALLDLPRGSRDSLLYHSNSHLGSSPPRRSQSPEYASSRRVGEDAYDMYGRGTTPYNGDEHNDCSTSASLKPPPCPVGSAAPGAQWTHHAGTTPRSTSQQGTPRGILTPTTRPRTVHVEIAPGVSVRLRGSQETKACIARDFYIPTMCTSCLLDPVFCIMDANYVVCPECRVVQPLEGGADAEYPGGVGLGFDADTLWQWQNEAWRQQQQQRRRADEDASWTRAAAARSHADAARSW